MKIEFEADISDLVSLNQVKAMFGIEKNEEALRLCLYLYLSLKVGIRDLYEKNEEFRKSIDAEAEKR